jgi:L-alanine-DL-glutamate epimerase-like enolase superfamily enzyme
MCFVQACDLVMPDVMKIGGVIREPLKIEHGYTTPPNASGIGLVWDEDAIRRFLLVESGSSASMSVCFLTFISDFSQM